MEKVQKIFQDFDENGDGLLDLSELATVLVKLGLKMKDANELLSVMDRNGDGIIQVEEFCAFLEGGSTAAPKAGQAKDDPDEAAEEEEEAEEDDDEEEENDNDVPPDDQEASDNEGDNAPDDAKDSLGHMFRAASSSFLSNGWLKDAKAVGLTRRAKVYEIEASVIRAKGEKVVCPRDGRQGAAYVDCLQGKVNVGVANFMLSYTWGYEIGDIADSIKGFCNLQGLDRKSTYFWTCCLCINQHRVREASAKGETVPFSQFQAAFSDRVTGIGKVLAMMQPWDEPKYIQRVWCDFEMYTATSSLTQGKVEVHVTMPPRESQKMINSLLKSNKVSNVFRNLSKLKVEFAEASVQEDKERILTLIKDGPGFHALNSKVAKHLQQWVLAECLQRYKETKDSGNKQRTLEMSRSVGELLRRVGRWDEAMQMLEDGIGILRSDNKLASKMGAQMLRSLGNLRRQKGQHDASMEALLEARDVSRKANILHTRQGGYLMRAIGKSMRMQKRIDEAMEALEEARVIFEKTGTLDTVDGADLMRDIATMQRQQGEHQAAQENLEKALTIRKKCKRMNDPDAAELLRQIGLAHHALKDFEEALKKFNEAKIMRERMAMMETVGGGGLMNNIGNSKREAKDLEGAIEAYNVSLELYRKAGQGNGASAKTVQSNLNRVKRRMAAAAKKK